MALQAGSNDRPGLGLAGEPRMERGDSYLGCDVLIVLVGSLAATTIRAAAGCDRSVAASSIPAGPTNPAIVMAGPLEAAMTVDASHPLGSLKRAVPGAGLAELVTPRQFIHRQAGSPGCPGGPGRAGRQA